MIRAEAVFGLPDYQITALDEVAGQIRMTVRFAGLVVCPHCGGTNLRNKERRIRHLRHESWGVRRCMVELETRKWFCRECAQLLAALSGILPRLRATEPFRRSVCQKHFDGISRSRLAQREKVSSATRALVR